MKWNQKKENEIKETIEIDGIPIQDYGTVNSRTVYPAEINTETIKSNINYWRNLYFEEKEKHEELLKEYNKKLYANWSDAISKDELKEKFNLLNKATKEKNNLLKEYMIYGDTERATGWFINLDFIEKVIFNEPGYILKED